MFQKRKGKLWTYISDMTGKKSQVDYILVNRKWKNSVKNSEAYSSFSSLGSDHRIVAAKVKLSLRTSKSPSKGAPYDWKALENPELQEFFSVEVNNRFNVLSQNCTDVTERYKHFVEAHNEACEKLIPKKKKKEKKKSLSKDTRVLEARQEVQKAFDCYQIESTKENQAELQTKKRALQKTYDTIESEELKKEIKKVEEANVHYRHAESWKLVNEITGRKTAKKRYHQRWQQGGKTEKLVYSLF